LLNASSGKLFNCVACPWVEQPCTLVDSDQESRIVEAAQIRQPNIGTVVLNQISAFDIGRRARI
jgi:hypothetical protein